MIQKRTAEDITKLSRDFEKNGFVIIPDFFEGQYALSVRDYFSRRIPQNKWFEAHTPVVETDEFQETYEYGDNTKVLNINDPIQEANYTSRIVPINNKTLSMRVARRAYARNAAGDGKFAYHFDRTVECNCGECDICILDDNLNSKGVRSLLHRVTGLDLKQTNTTFASRYTAGHFLTPHTDQDRGVLGIVYYINTEWNPSWGGLLHILDEESKIEQTVSPHFNSMGLFTLPKAHFVSQLASYAKWPRYNYVAWYDGYKQSHEKMPKEGDDFEE